MPAVTVFPIGYVSMTTGLSAHVLRAWEKRYTAVKPSRSASGRRLYSQEDIDRLVLLKKAVTSGHSISQIAGLDNATLAGLSGPAHSEGVDSIIIDPPPPIDDMVDHCLRAVTDLNDSSLHHMLYRAERHYECKRVIEEIIVPFMAGVGSRWKRGEMRIAHERLASGVVTAWLSGMLMRNQKQRSPTPRILIAAPAGQHCPLGAMAVAVIAQDCGWNPIPLGSDLPMEEIALAGVTMDVQLIALSLTCHLDDPTVDSDLRRFGELVADRCPFVVGGAASGAYRQSIAEAGGAFCFSSDELVDRFL
ncbi:MAG: MerR family transcriptional regulator [Desulfobacterales bacterium]|nr:MerR family transcriptional regulator [Desulfobacterales bacterium]